MGIVLPEGAVADHPGRLLTARERALQHLVSLQRDDGSWEGEVVWCTMILSQYVIVRHITSDPSRVLASLSRLRRVREALASV